MKTITFVKSLVLAVVVLLGIQTSALKAAEPTPEQIADAFAKAPISYWYGQYQFTGNTTNFVQAYFTLQLFNGRWAITQLRINEVELAIDAGHPLYEFPAYAGQVQNFWLNVTGYGADGQEKRHGYFGKESLIKTDHIRITVNLSHVYAKIPYTFTGDHNRNNTRIESEDGSTTGWYDSSTGTFVISFDPLRPPTGFNIIDARNNTVIGRIPFKDSNPQQDPQPDTGVGFGIELPNNTLEAYAIEKNARPLSFQQVELKTPVTRNGENYDAKIALLHVSDPTGYVQIYTYGLRKGSAVEIWGKDSEGAMQLLGTKVVPSDNGATLIINNLVGYETYKIVMIGQVLNPVSGANLDFYYSSYEWTIWSGDDGVGKGITPVASGNNDGSDDTATP